MSDPDAFPFEVVPSRRWPGWEVLICTRWLNPVAVGWYRTGHTADQERQAKDIRKLRALWAVTVAQRKKTRAAVAALKHKEPETCE